MNSHLAVAIEEAERGRAEGGIPIGAGLVHRGEIIGRGHNRRVQQGSAGVHGEMDALERAGRRGMAALAPAPSVAQQSTAEIRGRVLDPQPAAVPGVTVRVTNQETGTFRETLSNADGAYFIAALAPGSYALRAEALGFKKYSRKDVRLDLGHTTTVDLQLEIGNVAEEFTVIAE